MITHPATHPKQRVVEGNIEFWNNIQPGCFVDSLCRKAAKLSYIGQVERIVVCEAGQNVFGQCVVKWDDGTETVEHPMHLTAFRKVTSPQPTHGERP
jgi:hypothetical protein